MESRDSDTSKIDSDGGGPNGSPSVSPVSSSEVVVKRLVPKQRSPETDPRMADPVFATLAEPVLPSPAKLNRAWLQIQSPGRLFFYWSMKSDPFEHLNRAFPHADGYTLVARLVDLDTGRAETRTVGAEGDWWFDADPGRTYRAEIGFAAPARPYIRIIFSDTVETPRSGPSTRSASESEWAVSAELFSRVLDKSGYAADALAVTLAGEDGTAARDRTRLAFAELTGGAADLSGFDDEELRYAMLLLAAGFSLDQIRDRISTALYSFLLSRGALLSAQTALDALRRHFDLIEESYLEDTATGGPVFGASRINMPGRLRKIGRKLVPHGSSSGSGGHRIR